MASNSLEIKNRLRSIQSTQKITHAMKLVAISELQKLRSSFLKNREYDNALGDIVKKVIASQPGYDHPLFQVHEDTKPLTIVLSSDLGLAGAYIQNIFKLVKDHHQPHNRYLWIGHKGYESHQKRGYHLLNTIISSKDLTYHDLENLLTNLIHDYGKGNITSISLIYTEYVNAMTFESKRDRLLPFDPKTFGDSTAKEIIFEPNLETILAHLLPQFLNGIFFNRFLESKVSEYASRRLAMENATDNAEELIEELQLAFNKSRQADITADLLQMIDYDQQDEIIDIKHSYEQALDDLLNRKKVSVTTAYPLTSDQQKALKEALEQRFKAEVVLEMRVDAQLISGIQLLVDGQVIETTMKQALSELEKHIRSSGK